MYFYIKVYLYNYINHKGGWFFLFDLKGTMHILFAQWIFVYVLLNINSTS